MLKRTIQLEVDYLLDSYNYNIINKNDSENLDVIIQLKQLVDEFKRESFELMSSSELLISEMKEKINDESCDLDEVINKLNKVTKDINDYLGN